MAETDLRSKKTQVEPRINHRRLSTESHKTNSTRKKVNSVIKIAHLITNGQFNKGKTGFLESNVIGLSLLAHLQFKKNSRRQKEQRKKKKKKNTDALLKEIFRIFFLHFSHSSWENNNNNNV